MWSPSFCFVECNERSTIDSSSSSAPPKPVFYGQCGEDDYIYNTYFKNKRNGIFLELGALDGVTYSNTKFFEDTLGWSGVLIEPLPQQYERCRLTRPRSLVYNCIVSTSPDPLEFYVNGAVSSVKDHTSPHHFAGWHKPVEAKLCTIPSRRLDDILHEASIPRIDFWSLDVEGSEYEVLKTMDWDIPVHVLCMEVNGGESEDMNESCRDLLRQMGFVCDGKLAHNELWIGKNHSDV